MTAQRVKLSGLSGSNPLGAMAAFGLLRVLSIERPFGQPKLAWSFGVDWIPELHLEEPCDIDQLIEFLITRQTERIGVLFQEGWCDDIKSAPADFRELWKSVFQQFATDADLAVAYELAAFLTAYGSEVIKDKKAKPDVKPTAFHMTAGQQRFLKSAKEIADSLDPSQRTSRRQTEEGRVQDLREAYRTALNGPWTYQDAFHSLGWDPTTEGLYALSDSSPSEAGARSVRAAVWLAFESLPLFPAVPVGKRLHTTGFDRGGNVLALPIWEPAITLDALQILLGTPEIPDTDESDPAARTSARAALRARGVRAVMRSDCVRDANGRGTLRNAFETAFHDG